MNRIHVLVVVVGPVDMWELILTFPVLHGAELDVSFALADTPYVVC